MLLLISLSCQKTDNDDTSNCNVFDLSPDLLWLQDFINQTKKGNSNTSVFLCSYKDGIGFLLLVGCPLNSQCVLGPTLVLKNQFGDTLCNSYVSRFIYDCQDEYEVDLDNKILIYEIVF